MTERASGPLDPFLRHRVFPDAEHVFTFAPVTVDEALGSGIVVMDTNALLIPYNAGQASVEQIKRTYRQLVSERRMKVPGQVAREFAVHRAEKFKLLFQQLSRRRSTNVTASEYPLLEGVKEYAELLAVEKDLADKLKEYRNALTAVLQHVRGWRWDDPVSALYRELFNADVIVDPELDRDVTLKESAYRQLHKVPPGYKDAANEFSGIGDVLIWQTILAIGRESKRHVVFVSGDEKTDWLYQSENEALYPRYELLDEFRHASDGKTIHIISLASLLERTGASKAVVEQVRLEEATQAGHDADAETRRREFSSRAEHAVLRWLLARHPESEVFVNRDGFDFVLASPRGMLAIDVKSVLRPTIVRPLLNNWLSAIRSRKGDVTEVSLVVVCGDQRTLRRLERVLDGLSDRAGIRSVVCGVLTDQGAFAEHVAYTYNGPHQLKVGH